MYYLIYISTAVKLLTETDLTEILHKSIKNNSASGVTGMLLYADGVFMQALEGEEENVKIIYDAILQDKRHKNITKIIDDFIDKRVFTNWFMGFTSLQPGKMAELKGYIDPHKDNVFNNHSAHPAITALKTFMENNRLRATNYQL